jgi:rhodanese-related sulfurtransferase
MSTRNILSIILVFLGITSAILPERKNDSIELDEEDMLREMLSEHNYVSSDELADLLILGDPSIRIIDVRPADDFDQPIPRAINIPVDSILSDNYLGFFAQREMKNIIYGGKDKYATQVWMIMKQKGYLNNYILKGGLEQWEETILDPKLPASTASEDEFERYRTRLAAKQYFTGEKALPKVQIEPLIPLPTRERKKVQGGCS